MSDRDQDILATSPYDGDIDKKLAARPRRRPPSKTTLGLAAAVLLVAGVIVGIQAQKALGRVMGGAVIQQAMERGAGQGAEAPGRGLTTGTVERVTGDKIYVKTADGATVTVATSGDTRVQLMKKGKVADLAPGNSVTVRGRKADDGSVTATAVTQGDPGAGVRGPR
jgi:hypothetical protein